MDLSIVVPCYNEEGNVELFYEEVQKVFKGKKIKYEIVFVNDGSSDNTLDRLTNIVDQKKQNIKVINFSRNFGKEAAMYAGLKEAEGELVTIIDADLQQRPELILRMIDILNENEQFDSVAAFQEIRKEGKVLTFFKDTFYKVINSMSTVPFVQGASDFRTFRRKVVDSILELSEYHRFSKGIFSFVGYNTYYLPYEVEERNSGISKWNFFKLFNYAIDGIVAFTTSPLRAPFYISIVTFLVGFIYFIVALFKGVSEFTVILLVMLFLFSLLFMVVGVIGEYLSRTYIQVKQRPIYIVKERLESKKK
ncbi:MAG: glycosyltransferase family 2 protein [Clostridium sp.]|nr:glycosyltransferase family 2 protein [Clostridium sp.]